MSTPSTLPLPTRPQLKPQGPLLGGDWGHGTLLGAYMLIVLLVFSLLG